MSDTKPRVRVPAMTAPVTHDGLINMVSRLGTGADKSVHYRYIRSWADQTQIDAAYRTSIFRKAVDIPPSDMVREWRKYNGITAEQITAIEKEEKRLDLRRKLREALILARKDGNAVILLGAGGDASQKLNIENLAAGGLRYITVLTKTDIYPRERDRDPISPTFDEPTYWELKSEARTRVHPSRVIKFVGNPIRESFTWDGWNGESLFAVMERAVTNNDQIAGAIAALVDEAKVDVIAVENLMANLATQDGENLLVRRFAAINTLKSIVNAMVIDAKDTHTQKTLTFQGLTDIQQGAQGIVAALADIPVTRMWGRSAAGMNATGEGDLRNYYDGIRSTQTVDLTPTITPLDECLFRSALGNRPPELFYEWNPLYQLSEKEAAEVENTMADAAVKLANSGIVPDTALIEMVKGGLIERGQWPGAEKAYGEAEAAGDEPGLTAEPTEAEMAEEEARMAIAVATAQNPAGGAPQKPRLVASNDARFAKDAAPRTLYVRRDVVNRAEIVKWATAQGFTDIVPDLHVTVVYSTTPVDWFKVGVSWSSKIEIAAGGPRQMATFGTDAQVLLIAADELRWRHDEIIRAGAHTDYPEYQPHITITYGDMPENVVPYQGKIVLGPEIFETVRED